MFFSAVLKAVQSSETEEPGEVVIAVTCSGESFELTLKAFHAELVDFVAGEDSFLFTDGEDRPAVKVAAEGAKKPAKKARASKRQRVSPEAEVRCCSLHPREQMTC